VQGLDHRVQTPGVHVVLKRVFKTLEACGVRTDGPDIGWKNALLSRCGTDHLREPAQGGRAPVCPAHVPAILSAQKRLEPERGGFEIMNGIFPCPGKVTHGLIVHRGDRHHAEITRAGQAGQLHRIAAIRVDPLPWVFGDQGRCHHPTIVALLGQRAGEPVATGSSFRDEEEVCGCGWHLTDHLIDVRLSGAEAAEGGHFSAVLLRHVGDASCIVVDVHADEECARLRHS
jgi:hypothetical protein